MKKGLLIFYFSALLVSYVFGQIPATTKDGKKVILNNDGTWKYVKTESDSSNTNLNCSELLVTQTDKMTGKSSTSTKQLIISEDGGKTGFGIIGLISNETLVLSFRVAGAGSCIKEDSKSNFLFRDGTKIELQNDAKFNCKGDFTLYFGGLFGKKKEIETLKNKEIETLRIWTSDSYVQRDFTSQQSKQFMKSIECLTNISK